MATEKRFGSKDGNPNVLPAGEFVSVADHESALAEKDAEIERLRRDLEEAEDRYESCDNCERPSREEDLRVVWARDPESGEQVDARICAVCRAEAALQERDRAWRDALLSDDARRAFAEMIWPDVPGFTVGSAHDKGAVLTLEAVIEAARDSLPSEGEAGECERCIEGWLRPGDKDNVGGPGGRLTPCPDCTGKNPQSEAEEGPAPRSWPDEVHLWLDQNGALRLGEVADLPGEFDSRPYRLAQPDQDRSPGEGTDTELPEWAKVYSYLCGNCGEIKPVAKYGHFVYDNEGRFGPEGELVPAPEGEEAGVSRCPACGFDHEDNDSGPGVWAGTRAEMETERAKLIKDPIWADTWIQAWKEQAATPTQQPDLEEEEAAPYSDLSYRERVVCSERDRGISRMALAGRFGVVPERITQIENQARRKLATMSLTGERLETLIDRIIRLARSSDCPDLAIRAEALRPYRLNAQPTPEHEVEEGEADVREALGWALDWIDCEGKPDGFDPASEPENWTAHFDAGALLRAEPEDRRDRLRGKGLQLAVDLGTARARGVCPVCEGYGEGAEPEGHEDSDCPGYCPECWCPGCHTGQDFPEERIGDLPDGDPAGSWLAFELIHGPNPVPPTPEHEVERGEDQ